MNIETRLLNRALNDRNLQPLFSNNVQDSWFTNDDDRRVWKFVREHYTKYGECPSKTAIIENYPAYTVLEVDDSIDYLIDALVAQRRRFQITSTIKSAIEFLDKTDSHEDALLAMQRGLIQLEEDGLNQTRDVDLTSDTDLRWREYLERKNLPNGLRGYPTGFPTIDQATSGLQDGQLIVVVAPPKTGKSTLALQIAHNVHLTGLVPLFQSFEMSNIEQVTRYDAMRAKISHHKLTTGSLSSEEEKRYQQRLEQLQTMEHKFWLSDSGNGSTLSGIANKVQMLRPDILFIDGVYLMIDEQSGEANTPLAITNITRGLKRMAQRFQIPIVISTQALTWKMKKGNVTADSIGYSSSFFQDADVLFGLQREDDNIDDTRILKVLASRNSGPTEVSLLWDWNTGEFRELDGTDL